MKKYLIIILCLIYLISLSTTSFAKNETLEKNKETIKDTVGKYLDARYEAFVIGDIKPVQNFFNPTTIQETNNNKELDWVQILLDWRVPKNIFYDKFSVQLDFKSIQVFEKTATVEVREVASYIIKGHSVTSKEAYTHTIVLEKDNGKWYIKSDSFDEPIYNMLTQGMSVEEIKTKLFIENEIFTEGNISKSETQDGEVLLSSTYNRVAARDYADQYWTNYNNKYMDFTNLGGDCTNYVSQAMRAGGAPDDFSGTQGSQWWYDLSTHQYTPSWTSVNQLYEYLLFNTNGGPVGVVTNNLYYVNVADIVQFKLSGSNWIHSAIVTHVEYEDMPYIYVNAHTNDRYRYWIENYPGEKRFIRISIR